MTRSISIHYQISELSEYIGIDVSGYESFGTQRSSVAFWKLQNWKLIGVERLAELGHIDPIFFTGWEELAVLSREIKRFQDNLERLDFVPSDKARYLANLVYCYALLVSVAPRTSIPELVIG